MLGLFVLELRTWILTWAPVEVEDLICLFISLFVRSKTCFSSVLAQPAWPLSAPSSWLSAVFKSLLSPVKCCLWNTYLSSRPGRKPIVETLNSIPSQSLNLLGCGLLFSFSLPLFLLQNLLSTFYFLLIHFRILGCVFSILSVPPSFSLCILRFRNSSTFPDYFNHSCQRITQKHCWDHLLLWRTKKETFCS